MNLSPSYYEKFNFISPSAIFAEVKEDLRSYFNTGVVDDLLFPVWINRCLDKLKKTQYPIRQAVLNICDDQASLPQDFNSIREVWATTSTGSIDYQFPSGYYYQTDIRVTPDSLIDWCADPTADQVVPEISCDGCDRQFTVTHRVNGHVLMNFKTTFLLRPTPHVLANCNMFCANRGSRSDNEFDIRDGKIITNFSTGTVYMVYYAESTTEDGDQLIPDNVYVKEYLRKYIMYKVFEQLSNQITDETFNQVSQKMMYYKKEADDAFIEAEVKLKMETSNMKRRAMVKLKNRNNEYRIR